ncbi:MAG: TRAP transporter small permease [Spirochaetes bacterium]|nr:TRAP transporter small permease [Spirochaetota bacterium]MBU1080029.1 TRAP transporter small permease [Spirochaetota bacterium]
MSEGKGGPTAALEKASDVIDAIGGALCAGLFGAMTLVVIVGVFFRYVVNAPLSWTEEISRYLMIWGASVGISLGVRAEEHVGLTVILDAIKSRPVRMVFHTCIYLMVLGFVSVMFYYSLAMTRDGKYMQMQSLDMSMVIAFAAVPVAMLLAIAQLTLMYLLKFARGDDKPRGTTVIDI